MTTTYILESGDPYIRKRTEKGWTLDFVFNRDGIDWSGGTTFYYWGISGETIDSNYADNNLSFSFTDDGRVLWESIHYKTLDGTTPLYYTTTGQTSILCSGGTSNDFNLTIVFERYKDLEGCDLLNEGGLNDLITGKTTTTTQLEWLSGDTPTYTTIEVLSEKWYKKRDSRLGTLKIYLNGQKLYTLENWEEIIPSQRESENELVQIFGGGTIESGDIHEGETQFNLLQYNYYEYPFTFLQVKDNYSTNIKPNFNITECSGDDCIDDLIGLGISTPTPTPTPTSTSTPTPLPTNIPTLVPTSTPTPLPTDTPTPLPTSTPTIVPTSSPTPLPTNIPTLVPTSTPTPLPTNIPTLVPTSTPTFLPTLEPTVTPTPTP